MDNIVKVTMADLKMAEPPNKIRTMGLGSCVGIILYDEKSHLCGMAHIMLPSSKLSKQGTLNRAKYADTAIEDLLLNLKKKQAPLFRLKAKMAGGAQMFTFASSSEAMRIGPRNIEAVRTELKTRNIPLISEDVGGGNGRTIEFDPKTCLLEVRTVNKEVKTI
ncbi:MULTISPECIES: chemotaxis protein CheD [Alteribacter]|uniref:Probable chemoreceptor glutamine deamidase CheD n=1 Tax=Alteribacter keqinensis TaxID=2483800 RepID=A0A3M7TWA4_9BACI|nr:MULTISPECIES: chemotaxis protein CheD [Alteribacter]MBM7094197.1 chemotaxis protein CheD [Alteribacter salitolerans]RNA69571.1 chemotaxis protein CheD [Alteribacter keqinensis]